jgi:hypothetical protein
VTFKAANNKLTEIDPELIKRLESASLIDFTNNTCIDTLYDKSSNDTSDIHVFSAEVVLKCPEKKDSDDE